MPVIAAIIHHGIEEWGPDETAANAINQMQQVIARNNAPIQNVEALPHGHEETPEYFDGEFGESVAYSIDSTEAQKFIEEQRELAIENIRNKFNEALEIVDNPETDRESWEAIIGSDDLLEAFLNDPVAVNNLHHVIGRFGRTHRLYDLTDWAFGYPIDTEEELDELLEYCEKKDSETYVVGLRTRYQ